MSVRTGMFPPPSVGPAASGMPGPMPPMGAAPNPFAPMPPMPLAGMPPPPPMGGMPPPPMGGMPPPPMAQAPMPQPSGAGLGSVAGSNAPRRRMFGDFLESKLVSGQARPAPQMARPPQMPQQQRMVAPGTPAMRTPTPRPMMYGGEVDVFGYEDGGPVVQYYEDAGEVQPFLNEFDTDSGTYTIAAGGDPDTAVQYSYGTTYDDPTTETVEELPADVAYSKRVQENRAAMGLPANTTSAWAMYQRGEHYSQGRPVVEDVVEDDVDLIANDNVDSGGGIDSGGGNVVVAQPVSSITGSQSGAGSAANAGGNFGTGSYTADAVDASEVNPIDYSQFTGDVGNFSNTGEDFALYGPKLNIPQSVSQYMTGPSGGLTTSYGPEMVATSPIGAIKLPARPVSIDIFDWLSAPTYGTMYSGIDSIDTGGVDLYDYGSSVQEMREGGAVPRQTMIGDQPHMLAYINPQEAELLSDLGGSGEPGPGGVPAYRNLDADLGIGATNSGKTYSGNSSAVSGGYSHPTDGDDDNNNTSSSVAAANAAAAASMLSAGVGNVGGDKVYSHSTDNDDDVDDVFGTGNIFTETSPGASTVDFGTGSDDDVDDTFGTGNIFTETTEGASTVDFGTGTGSSGSGGGGGVPSYTPPPVYVPPVYTDKRGNTYDSQAAADAANQAIDAFNAQLMSYGAGNEFFNRFADKVSKPYMPREDSDRAASQIYSTRVTPEMAADSYRGPDILGGIYSNISGIGSSDLGTGDDFGNLTAQPIVDSNIDTSQSPSQQLGQYGIDDDIFNLNPEAKESTLSQAVRADVGQDYTPTSAELAAQLAAQGLTNVTPGPLSVEDQVSPFEETQRNLDLADIGRQLQNNEITVADIEEDILAGSGVRPANAGLGRGSGFKSLEQLKSDISKVEGTGDDAGYNRLLDKGETGTFSGNKPLTEMTVAEAIAFGTSEEYRNYSRDVLGRGPNELPSTPMGKYQIVGTTLKDLVDRGLVDPNAQFDADTQEQIGSLLVKNRGYDDVLSGKITEEQFLSNLGKEFEGVKKDEDFSLSGGSVDSTGINQVSDKNSKRPTDAEVVKASVEAVKPGASEDEISKIKAQLDASVPVQGFGKFISNIGKGLFLGLGADFVQGLVDKTEAERANIVNLHMDAINNGATPQYDDDGKYIGYDNTTTASFGQKVINYSQDNDISALLPPSLEGGDFKITQADIDEINRINKMYEGDQAKIGEGLSAGDTITLGSFTNDNAIDSGNARFQQVYDAQSKAAELDPYGTSTENGFITSDGQEFIVTLDGKLVEVEDGVVGTGESILNSGLGTGTEIATILGDGDDTNVTSGDDDTTTTTEVDTSYTTDENGNKICNQAGYVYDVATDACVPAVAEEESTDTSLNIGSGASRSFEDVLKNIQTKPTTIAPISANIKPMAQGGMAGLNRTADNFLRALGG